MKNNNFSLKHKSATDALPMRYPCGKMMQPSGWDNTSHEGTVSLKYPLSIRIVKALSRTAAVLTLLLTLGVGQANAIGFNQGNIFFDATGWTTTNYVYFVVGKSNYSSVYQLNTHVANTNLYRAWCSNNGWWDGCTYFGVVGTSGSWDSGAWGSSNLSNAGSYTAAYTDSYDINSSNIYVLQPSSSANGSAFSITYKEGITGLNNTQTLTVQVKGAGDANYSDAANCYGTSISASTHYFNSAWDSADQDGSISLSTTTVTGNASAALSSTVSLSLSGTPTTGYQFDGWYYSDGTLISTSTSCSYVAQADKTVYARFSEKTFTVTMTNDGHGTTSPASSGTFGQITGGAISATPATGYNFSSWSKTSGDGSFVSVLTTNSNTFKPTSAATIRATFTPKTYTITLDGNSGSDGSATATYNSSTLTSVTGCSRASYDLNGYYTATSGGTKIINADGTLVASTSYTDGSGNWTYDDVVELHAQWTYNPVTYSVTYAVGTGYTSLGSLAAANTSTSAAIASGSSLESGTGVTFTATPNTGYTVEGWYTDAACSAGKHDAGSTTYSTTLSKNITVYVKFVEKTWTVSFANDSYGTTSPNSDQTVGQLTGVSVSATPSSGYEFSTWTITSGSGSFTSAATTASNTFKPTAASTITASFSEIMRTITIVGGTVTSSAATSTTAGVATYRSITANAPAAGKKFTGWTLGTGVSLKGGYSLTDRTIEIYSTADATVTANYADRASVKVYFAKPSGWSTVYAHAWKDGGTGTSWPGVNITSNTITTNHVTYYYFQYYTEADGIGNAATGSSTWNEVLFSDNGDEDKRTANLSLVDGHYYFKSTAEDESGKTAALTSAWCIKGAWNSWSEDADQITHSEAATGSKTIELTTGAKEFKIYNIVDETWWRFSGNVSADKVPTDMANNIDGNMTLTPTIAGNYTFDLSYLTGTPKLAITFPTTYTLSYSIGSIVGTDGSISSDPTTASGSYVASGNTVTLTAPNAKTGYTWKGWYGAANGSGDQLCATQAYAVTMNADKTLYACYTENDYTVTVAAGANGAVASTSVTGHKDTKVTLPTATPNVGYVFTGWTVTTGTATLTDASSAAAAQVNGLTAAATVTANFAAATAFIEGRFHITNASRNGSWTNTFGEGDWNESSTAIKFTWDGTNSRYYLHTYATPHELTTQISSQDPVFYIKESSSSSSLANVASYWSATSQTLTAAGTGNKRTLAHTGDVDNDNLKFNSADESGYAILYFDEAGIWYELEQTLKYDGNGNTGGSAPAGTVYYDKGATATAAANTYTRTNYTFAGWNTQADGNGTSYAADASITMNSNITLYAQWSEDSYNATVSAGSGGSVTPNGTVAIKQVNGTELTATPSTYYLFKDWTISGGGIAPKSPSTTTSNPATFTATTTGGTIQANFKDKWCIAGGDATDDNDDDLGDWSTDANPLTYTSGTTVEGTVSITTPGTYSIKVVDRADGKTWYGKNDASITRAGATVNDLADDGGNITFVADVAGSYIFSYDVSGADLTVTYPTAYTVTYGVGTVAGCASVTPTPSFSSGDYVAAGTSITFAKSATLSGYSWKGWYANAAGTGDAISTTDASYVSTSRAAAYTIYACFTEDTHTVTLAHTGNGHVEISSSTVTSVSGVGIASASGTITAVPDKGYYFTGWTGDINDGVTLASGSASTASITINATADSKTITANFAPIWAVVGGDSAEADGDGDEMGDWSATANLITNIGTNAGGKDTGYVNITLPANTTFYFKAHDRSANSNNMYGNTGTMNYAANNRQAWDMAANVANSCGIVTAGKGTYKFAWNFTDKKVTVTYPTSYTVTFGYGTGGTAVTANGSVSGSITSGQYVAASEDVTFTQTPDAGYTFKGWYTTSDGNTTVSTMAVDDNILNSIAANATVYAQYTENIYTVTVTAEHGTITTPAAPATTVSAGISTAAPIVAEAIYGYIFNGWTVESGTATIADASDVSTTVNATSDATIKANFISHWTIAGGNSASSDGADEMGDWNDRANGIDHFTEISADVWEGYVDINLPANTTFYFKVRDLNSGEAWYGNSGEMTYGNHTGWTMTSGSSNCRITTAGKGTYRFTWNETNKQLTVTYPESYTVTYSTYMFMGDDESNSESTAAGSISSITDAAGAFTSGKYVTNDSTVTFTHSAATTNYHFAGWYSDAACTTAYTHNGTTVKIDEENRTLKLKVSADTTVYAKFAENMTTVNLVAVHGKIQYENPTDTWNDAGSSITAGTVTTRRIKAVPATGYYFAGWTKTACTDYSITGSEDDEDNNPITLAGLGAGATSGQTLTANFLPLEKVYFRNWNADSDEPLWENVYAYFSITFVDNCANSNSSSEYTAIEMQREGSSNVYWAYVPRGTTRYSNVNIAFSNHAFATNYKFHEYEAVKRADYKAGLSMFVPQHSGNTTINDTKYYNGYWKHHNVAAESDAGYRIERYTGSGYVNPADNGDDSVKFLVGDENTIIYKLRVDNLSEGYNNYMIYSVGSVSYITFDSSPVETGYTVTTSNHSNIGLSEYNSGSPRFYITPTSEAIYTLTIDMSGDVMRLNVTYPIAVGDYQLVHSYNDGSAKISRSDVIKTDELASRKYSMFIDNKSAHSPSLKLKKCTGLSEGSPVWNSGETVSMTGFKADTAGVFVFDVAVDNKDSATLSNIEAYRGNYYIKTDCADGGWTAYTSNVLDYNSSTFNKAKATTYDYYYCKWINDAGTNIKCVIANDYCIAVSDTLVDDAVAGGQTMPMAGNVRFSYNSTTNQLKRTYINGSANWEDRYLLLSGDARIRRTDDVAFVDNDTTFTDMNNWIYQLDLDAQTNAKVLMTAQFNGHRQYMLGSTDDSDSVQIVGGSTSAWFPMRLVYDFKTDKLIAGYLPGTFNVETSQAIYSDVLIIRNGQDDAAQLTFNSGEKLTEVKTVYGVLEFDKAKIQATGAYSSLTRYERNTYFVSFPFDVRLDQVTGFGTYGKHWILQYYDGDARGRNGAWVDSPNYWTYVMPSARDTGFVMKAYEGYLVSLSLSNMTPESFWTNGVTTVSLYFPSKEPVRTINGTLPEAASFVVPAHPCTIERNGRYYKDANWNVIGVPSYANVTRGVQDSVTIDDNKVPFLYTFNTVTNFMDVNASESVTFGAMKAYMVQYAGTINWNTKIPRAVAARRSPAVNAQTLRLTIQDEAGNPLDRTFIRFNDESTALLDAGKDLTKVFNEGTANLYSLCQDIELGAQCMPLTDETVYIPVGVKAYGNTTIEFGLPDGTKGLEVWLYDREEDRYTNLLTSTYTATIADGKQSERFLLQVRRAELPTDVLQVNSGDQTTKYMQNGHLYIKQGNQLYNAEGQRVHSIR